MIYLTIGQVSKQTNVNIETIRYYERLGLLPNPPRRPSGYRQYNENVVQRLHFIKKAKELGFSLKEIKELLSLRISSKNSCAHVRRHAEIKIQDVEQKIKTLQKIKQALKKLSAECHGKKTMGECPILEKFYSKED